MISLLVTVMPPKDELVFRRVVRSKSECVVHFLNLLEM